jgi:hypothetical protein
MPQTKMVLAYMVLSRPIYIERQKALVHSGRGTTKETRSLDHHRYKLEWWPEKNREPRRERVLMMFGPGFKPHDQEQNYSLDGFLDASIWTLVGETDQSPVHVHTLMLLQRGRPHPKNDERSCLLSMAVDGWIMMMVASHVFPSKKRRGIGPVGIDGTQYRCR